MTPTEAATILRQFNEWRRGADGLPPHRNDITEAIDAAVEMIERLELAESSIAWHQRRWMALQMHQTKMREPERTMVCDILANGELMHPTVAGDRYALPGAQPAPSLASNDVSLISEGKTQPAPSVKDVIIDDLQSQFDTEGITEHDSGDALIRLYDAIAAVEDNFALAQPAPSVPEGFALVNATHFLAVLDREDWRTAKNRAELRAMLAAEPAQSVPEGWKPIPEKHPTFDLVDLRLADGSVLCGCVPQSDGDYWWEGPSGEVFIDPRYAPVTHWRLAAAPEAKP